jgi:hypothetical protein
LNSACSYYKKAIDYGFTELIQRRRGGNDVLLICQRIRFGKMNSEEQTSTPGNILHVKEAADFDSAPKCQASDFTAYEDRKPDHKYSYILIPHAEFRKLVQKFQG